MKELLPVPLLMPTIARPQEFPVQDNYEPHTPENEEQDEPQTPTTSCCKRKKRS